MDVRGAGRDGYAIGDRDARHAQRGLKIRRTVVDAGQHVAMKINHNGALAKNLSSDRRKDNGTVGVIHP
jgi:hypothetical protein